MLLESKEYFTIVCPNLYSPLHLPCILCAVTMNNNIDVSPVLREKWGGLTYNGGLRAAAEIPSINIYEKCIWWKLSWIFHPRVKLFNCIKCPFRDETVFHFNWNFCLMDTRTKCLWEIGSWFKNYIIASLERLFSFPMTFSALWLNAT